MVASATLVRTDLAGRINLLFTKKFSFWMGVRKGRREGGKEKRSILLFYLFLLLIVIV
jgi:hypothetical protein